jgi:serine protease Do
VIGINAMIIQPGTGIGFAIPINMAKQILNDLIKQGKVVRPWLGISIQDLTPEMMEHFKVKEKEGVLIGQVYPGTGAEKAGLASGDIIKSVEDKAIKNVNELVKEIQKKKVGQKVKLNIIRDGKGMTIEVTTTSQPDKPEFAKEKEAEEKLGARVQELTPQLALRYRISGVKRGVIVIGVEDGSLADEMGLQEGDVILEINRKKIETIKDFEKAMKEADLEKGVLFHLHRKGSSFYLTYKK